jgi:hypothetical protein
MIMNEKLSKYQKLYILALRSKLAKADDKVFNSGNECKQIILISKFNNLHRYKNNRAEDGKMGDGILPPQARNG